MSQSPHRSWKAGRIASQAGIFAVAFVVIRYIVRLILGSDGGTASIVLIAGTALIALTLAVVLMGIPVALFTARATVENMTIREGFSDGWPPASFAMRERFRALGFEQFGSIDVEFSDHTATFAGMLSPDGCAMGIVTPMHVVFLSDFDGKLLTTSNTAAGAAARYELRQTKHHGSPEELWKLHQSGLDATRRAEISPTVFNAGSAMATFMAIEEQSKNEFVMKDQFKYLASGTRVGGGVKSLAHDPRALARIIGWRDSPHRWHVAFPA